MPTDSNQHSGLDLDRMRRSVWYAEEITGTQKISRSASREVWDLIEQLEALRKALEELIDAAEYVACYPEGAVGLEELHGEAIPAARAALNPASSPESA